MKTYKTWIIENYIDEDSLPGDFARDVKLDPEFPDTCNQEIIEEYLTSKFVDVTVLLIFHRTFECYIKEIE